MWDGGAWGLKEGTGIDCGQGRSEGWIRGGKGERGKLAPLGWNLRPLFQAAGGEIRYSLSLSTLTQDWVEEGPPTWGDPAEPHLAKAPPRKLPPPAQGPHPRLLRCPHPPATCKNGRTGMLKWLLPRPVSASELRAPACGGSGFLCEYSERHKSLLKVGADPWWQAKVCRRHSWLQEV